MNKVEVVTTKYGRKIKEVILNGSKVAVIDVSVDKKMGEDTFVTLRIPVNKLTWITDQADS